MPAVAATARIVCDFNDRALNAERWSELLQSGETDTVFLTWWWQRAWWEVFGRGQLLLAIVERNGEPVAIAPLFCDAGMVFFVGSGGSDYLDFVGETSEDGVLESLLDAARSEAKDFVGFRFYHVPDRSRTTVRLRRAATALGLAFFDEGEFVAPSDCEGGPGFVYLEAMACGVPVTACTGSGASEVVLPDEKGLLVPPRDVDALVQALLRLLRQHDYRENMGQQARDFAVREVNRELCLRRLESFYLPVVKVQIRQEAVC